MKRMHHWFVKKKRSSRLIQFSQWYHHIPSHSDLLDNLNPLHPSYAGSPLFSSLLTPFCFGTFTSDSLAFSLPTSYLLDTTARYIFLKQYLIIPCFLTVTDGTWSLLGLWTQNLSSAPSSHVCSFIQGWLMPSPLACCSLELSVW